MARGVRGQAVRQAREMVDLLGHHPSVAVWCVHDEPFRRQQAPTSTPPIVGQQRPSGTGRCSTPPCGVCFNAPMVPARSSITPPSHRTFPCSTGRRATCGSVGTTARPMISPRDRPPSPHGTVRDRVRGGQRRPTTPELQAGRWPALDWNPIAAAVGARRRSLHHLAPPERTSDGPAWAETTRQAQADVLRTTIETLRKVKYRPTGGFCAFYLADPDPPAASAS